MVKLFDFLLIMILTIYIENKISQAGVPKK